MEITININGSNIELEPFVQSLIPSQVEPTKFRKDMNIFLAIDTLVNDYIEEALHQAGEGRGQRTRAAKLLGFDSYQAFAYWVKRREKKSVGG